ncbi:hypothetical protein DRQ09_09880, partial [candidate division KSB1 bacterium]
MNFLFEDDSGNFRLFYLNSDKFNEEKVIDKNGELLRFIRVLNEPIMFDEVSAKVNDERAIEILRSVNSYLLVPLSHRGLLSGILSLGPKIYSTKFTYEDKTMLNVLSNQMVIALENSKLYEERIEKEKIEEELSLAREIQKSLLPSKIPSGENFEISALSIPCREVGGDYFDFFEFPDNKLGIAIGDVAGKGVPAALLMSNIQANIRTLVQIYGYESSLRKIGLNNILNKINFQLRNSTTPEKFITFFYGVIDFKTGELYYSNAGHNYPIIIKEDKKDFDLKMKSFALGIVDNPDYKEKSIKLDRGDTVVFYTDGITEAFGPFDVEFGEERLKKIIKMNLNKKPEEIIKIVYDDVINYSKGYYPVDDITL